jgi:Domain of unknown function (DUF4136)
VAVKRIALFATALFLATSGAIGQDVRYSYNFDTRFEKFKTYKWVEIEVAQKVQGLKDKETKSALDATLTKKGLTKTDGDSADLYIGYQDIGLSSWSTQ